MTLFALMGLISTIALSLPILFIAVFKLAWYRSFPALMGYYIILFSYNLFLLGYIPASAKVSYYHIIVNDLLTVPLVLFFLTYFCNTAVARKTLSLTILGFLVFEIIAISVFGIGTLNSKYAAVPGLAFTLALTLYFFIQQVKVTIMHHKGIGKALIGSSLFFAMVGYAYKYSVINFVNQQYANDADLLFFLISILSSISMTAGLFVEQKRIRQLEELKTTREELKALYGEEEEKTTAPYGAVVLNFDKEQWN